MTEKIGLWLTPLLLGGILAIVFLCPKVGKESDCLQSCV